MTPTFRVFADQFDAFLNSEDQIKLIGPLTRTAVAHLRTRPPMPEIAAPLASVWHRSMDFESSWVARGWTRSWFFVLEHFVFPGRPLWNDFWMALWLLSRDPYYVCCLHRHIAVARRKKRAEQFETAVWMVTSVCQQDEEFKKCWEDETQSHGDVFAGVLS